MYPVWIFNIGEKKKIVDKNLVKRFFYFLISKKHENCCSVVPDKGQKKKKYTYIYISLELCARSRGIGETLFTA